MKNYIRLHKPSLFYKHYMFIDVMEYLADDLFIHEDIHVHFGREYHRQDSEYLLIFCRISKKDEEKFLHVMQRLDCKMHLNGYSDYTDFCNEIIEAMEA